MAAFTTFDHAQLDRYLYMFGLGELESFEPIETGIENSNYLVTLSNEGTEQEYVLTILEYLSFDDVPFFNTLMSHLSRNGLPVPAPQQTLDGMTSTIFRGKPTLLFPKLPGEHPANASASACVLIGRTLAKLHEATRTLAMPIEKMRKNPYPPRWVRTALEQVSERLTDADRTLLARYAERYEEIVDQPALPRGIIHGDLFRDNTLFVGEELTGIIDFYHACEDVLIQDLAITLNEWCSSETGQMDSQRAQSMIDGYESVRSLTDEEREMLPGFQQTAALRFVLTRLLSGEEESHLKDPEEFLRIARSLDSRNH